ncbi:uncharacterized protein LOC144137582 [Haemaphysalis longicornis]
MDPNEHDGWQRFAAGSPVPSVDTQSLEHIERVHVEALRLGPDNEAGVESRSRSPAGCGALRGESAAERSQEGRVRCRLPQQHSARTAAAPSKLPVPPGLGQSSCFLPHNGALALLSISADHPGVVVRDAQPLTRLSAAGPESYESLYAKVFMRLSAMNAFMSNGASLDGLGKPDGIWRHSTFLPRLPSGKLVQDSVFLHADLEGRPYRAQDFRDGLREAIDLHEISSIGQFQMSHVWIVTCRSSSAKAKLVATREMVVNERRCVVIDPELKEVRMKLLWLPELLEDVKWVKHCSLTAKLSISGEKWRVPGMKNMQTLNSDVVLALADRVAIGDIPHQLFVSGVQSLALIPGRPLLCLRCNRVSHIRLQCRMPRCGDCHRFGHSADECVVTFADKLRRCQRPPDEVLQEHLVDATEVFDAAGELPSALVGRTSGLPNPSTCAVNGSSSNAAPDVTAASVVPKVTSETSISSLEPVSPSSNLLQSAHPRTSRRSRLLLLLLKLKCPRTGNLLCRQWHLLCLKVSGSAPMTEGDQEKGTAFPIALDTVRDQF